MDGPGGQRGNRALGHGLSGQLWKRQDAMDRRSRRRASKGDARGVVREAEEARIGGRRLVDLGNAQPRVRNTPSSCDLSAKCPTSLIITSHSAASTSSALSKPSSQQRRIASPASRPSTSGNSSLAYLSPQPHHYKTPQRELLTP